MLFLLRASELRDVVLVGPGPEKTEIHGLEEQLQANDLAAEMSISF